MGLINKRTKLGTKAFRAFFGGSSMDFGITSIAGLSRNGEVEFARGEVVPDENGEKIIRFTTTYGSTEVVYIEHMESSKWATSEKEAAQLLAQGMKKSRAAVLARLEDFDRAIEKVENFSH